MIFYSNNLIVMPFWKCCWCAIEYAYGLRSAKEEERKTADTEEKKPIEMKV